MGKHLTMQSNEGTTVLKEYLLEILEDKSISTWGQMCQAYEEVQSWKKQ